MLCDTCKNKHICKYYETFNTASIKLVVQVNECELFSGNSQPILHNPDLRPMFREPLPIRPVDNTFEEEFEEQDEEKVYINIEDIDNVNKSESIIDIVMKGDKIDGKKKN